MKSNKIILALIAAALLPTFAYAGTDMVSAGLESDLVCKYVTATKSTPDMNKVDDPVEGEITAWVNSTNDPILASYYRDMRFPPISYTTVKFTATPDPYLDALILAFYGPAELEEQKIC